MLTEAQFQVFRAAFLAETDPTLVAYRESGATPLIAEWYNTQSTPDFFIWRNFVEKDEITQNGFDWTRLDNLSIGKARVWDGLFDNLTRSMNPSKPNVRAGIETVWGGTAADLAVRAAVYSHCRRPTTRIERLFATGLGTTAAPATAGFFGPLTETDVTRALQG